MPLDRRALILAGTGAAATSIVNFALAGCERGPRPPAGAGDAAGDKNGDPDAAYFAELESRLGGEIGFAAYRRTEAGLIPIIAHRAAQRFAMCSTFKWALGAIVLQAVAAGRLALDQQIPFSRKDIISYSPVTEPALAAAEATHGDAAEARMSVGDLCAAAAEISDNAAANLLLALIGGPAGFTAAVRGVGDQVTRLDRWELELNENLPGDPRDTTTPAAMAGLMDAYLFGDALSPADRAQVRAWMIGAKTGLQRLRAGLPEAWRVGDKTGTSWNGAVNNVAFAFPGGRADDGMDDGMDDGRNDAPLLIASYLNVPGIKIPDANAVHAGLARRLAERVAG